MKPATGDTTQGVNGHVITIEGLADVTEGGTAALPGACDGAAARFARANREGGVNGYTIKYLGCKDTGGNPATVTQLTNKAVEQDHVFAMVPYSTFAGNGTLLNQKHIPYFGFGVSPAAFCGWNNMQFGFSVTSAEACTTAFKNGTIYSNVGLVAYTTAAKIDPHNVKVAIVASQTPEDIAAAKGEAVMAKAIGMQVVYSTTSLPGPTSPSPSDYTPIALAIINSGANFVFNIANTPNELLGVSGTLKANGYKGGEIQFTITEQSSLSVSAIVQALNGSVALTPQVGSAAFPSAQFTQIQKDLTAIHSTAPIGVGTLTSYGSADLFLAALAKVNGPLTTEKLAAVLNSGFTYPGYGNAVCGSDWPAAHVAASNCGAVVQINGSTLAPVKDLSNLGQTYFVSLSS